MKKLTLVASLLLFSWHGFGQVSNQEAINQAKMKYTLSLKFNDFAEAKSAIYDLLVLEPNNHSYLDSLAYMYFEFGQYASAALVSQEALRYNNQNQVLLQVAAQSLKQLGAADKSLQMYQRLYNLSDDIYTLYEIAMLQYQLKEYEDAMINTELLMGKPLIDNKVSVMGSNDEEIQVSFKAVVFNLQGMIESARGNTESARKYFNNALKIAPDYALPKENLNPSN